MMDTLPIRAAFSPFLSNFFLPASAWKISPQINKVTMKIKKILHFIFKRVFVYSSKSKVLKVKFFFKSRNNNSNNSLSLEAK